MCIIYSIGEEVLQVFCLVLNILGERYVTSSNGMIAILLDNICSSCWELFDFTGKKSELQIWSLRVEFIFFTRFE
jgi:hypothetical protein